MLYTTLQECTCTAGIQNTNNKLENRRLALTAADCNFVWRKITLRKLRGTIPMSKLSVDQHQ